MSGSIPPYLADQDFILYQGDALEVLRSLPDRSIQCCVTSPPYWGLRDYGSEGQLGLEATPEAYVAALVAVFSEVRRVLADDGTLWLNLGDCYSASRCGPQGQSGQMSDRSVAAQRVRERGTGTTPDGLKPKDLVGIPWRVAFALQADGWYLRSDIIWSKPNPMPESVIDRPTKAHEYVFLLSKSARYYYDAQVIAEEVTTKPGATWEERKQAGATSGNMIVGHEARNGTQRVVHGDKSAGSNLTRQDGFRNARSVWEIATQPYAEAHFATFPQELARRAILAGCPEQVCATCGKPRERILERTSMVIDRSERTHDRGHTRSSGTMLEPSTARTTGWTDCGHNNYIPGTVLDPFTGSGTTALVARNQGRQGSASN